MSSKAVLSCPQIPRTRSLPRGSSELCVGGLKAPASRAWGGASNVVLTSRAILLAGVLKQGRENSGLL